MIQFYKIDQTCLLRFFQAECELSPGARLRKVIAKFQIQRQARERSDKNQKRKCQNYYPISGLPNVQNLKLPESDEELEFCAPPLDTVFQILDGVEFNNIDDIGNTEAIVVNIPNSEAFNEPVNDDDDILYATDGESDENSDSPIQSVLGKMFRKEIDEAEEDDNDENKDDWFSNISLLNNVD